jgi:hypothetical protein
MQAVLDGSASTEWLGGALTVPAATATALSAVTWEGAATPGANPFNSFTVQVLSGTVTFGGATVDAANGIQLTAGAILTVQQTAGLEGKYAFSAAGATLRITAEIRRIA